MEKLQPTGAAKGLAALQRTASEVALLKKAVTPRLQAQGQNLVSQGRRIESRESELEHERRDLVLKVKRRLGWRRRRGGGWRGLAVVAPLLPHDPRPNFSLMVQPLIAEQIKESINRSRLWIFGQSYSRRSGRLMK